MKGRGLTLFFLVALALGASAVELRELKVMILGHDKERMAAFESFLGKQVKSVETANRKEFSPARASAFDVVLLDWQQNESSQRDFPPTNSPIGPRDQWSKPTVLLGSAGLHMAIVWKLKGGSG